MRHRLTPRQKPSAGTKLFVVNLPLIYSRSSLVGWEGRATAFVVGTSLSVVSSCILVCFCLLLFTFCVTVRFASSHTPCPSHVHLKSIITRLELQQEGLPFNRASIASARTHTTADSLWWRKNANSTTYAADDAQGRSAPSSEGHDDSKFGGDNDDTRNIANVTLHELKRVKEEDEEQLAAEEEEEEQRRRRDELG